MQIVSTTDMDGVDVEVKHSYLCTTCKQLFFSMRDVTNHKAMTGHGQYQERVRQ